MSNGSTRINATGATETIADYDDGSMKHQAVVLETYNPTGPVMTPIQAPAVAGQAAATTIPAAELVYDSALGMYVPAENAKSMTDADAGLQHRAVATALWNGSSFDRERSNMEGTLLASAARTATTSSPSQKNYAGDALMVFLNVSVASGTGGLTTRLRWYDPVSGSQSTLHSDPAAVTATGNFIYAYGLGCTGPIGLSLKAVYSIPVPRTFDVTIVHGDASSYTYSVGYALLRA